jgi:hypothetical protein
LAAWLEHNSPRLEAFTLITNSRHAPNDTHREPILRALVTAAAAAQAAGRPLRLHTLRVLPGQVHVRTAGQLVAALPHLRCLQIDIHSGCDKYSPEPDFLALLMLEPPPLQHAPLLEDRHLVLEALAPLQHATQLEELYLTGPGPLQDNIAAQVPGLLPLCLRRLSWQPNLMVGGRFDHGYHDLSHLTLLNFLWLGSYGWSTTAMSSTQLPSSLQQLHMDHWDYPQVREVLEERQQVVHEWVVQLGPDHEQQVLLLPRLDNLAALSMHAYHLMHSSAARAAIQQLPHLSRMTVSLIASDGDEQMQAVVGTAAAMRSLVCLHLDLEAPLQPLAALTALTGLTQLMITVVWTRAYDERRHEQRLRQRGEEERQRVQEQEQERQQQLCGAWGNVLGRMVGLRRLSVPDYLLGGGWAWLAGLPQLRVLLVRCGGRNEYALPVTSIPWLEEWTFGATIDALGYPAMLLPQLQVLVVSGITAEQAATWQVRRRLRQLVGSSGCEVVVGPDLDEVAHPNFQMAGLPLALQQALA